MREASRRLWPWILVVLVVAAIPRLWELELKPPHHDEGVNGFFGERVLSTGYYDYDPSNFHGPTYFYAVAVSRALFGHGLWQLRLPSVLFGILICLTPFLAARRIGRLAAAAAGVLLAISPSMVYFSRHSIHESLLVLLMLVCLTSIYRWAEGDGPRWVIAAAAAAAGMIVTKETAVLFFAPAAIWIAIDAGLVRGRWFGRSIAAIRERGSLKIAAIALGVSAAIYVLFYTGFFVNERGPGESLARSFETYALWFSTGEHGAGHEKAWWYYLDLLRRYEPAIAILGLGGAVAGRRERVARAHAILAAALVGVYSLIPYKTPWLHVDWVALMALPAGVAIAAIVRAVRGDVGRRRIAGLACAAGASALIVWSAIVCRRVNYVRPTSPAELIAYVQTDMTYHDLVATLEDAAARRSGRESLRVLLDSNTPWPIPWAVSPYEDTYDLLTADPIDHDVVIASNDEQAASVEPRLSSPDSYDRRTLVLRSGVTLTLFLHR
jgi:uncharacterized protein (TIGR03663 family)